MLTNCRPQPPTSLASARLGHGDAADVAARGEHAGEQDDHRRAGADDQGVDEHAEGLDDPLVAGVGNVGHRGHVGGAAEAGFVGEQSALYPQHDRRPDPAGERRFQAEGAAEDRHERAGHRLDVHGDDHQGDGDVADRHDRDDELGDLGDALDAAEDDHSEDHDEADPARQRRNGEGVGKRRRHRVGLQRAEGEAEGDEQEDGKDDRHPALLQRPLHVVGRAAAIGAVGLGVLEHLRQGALEVARRHADEAHHPHPEDRARAAEADGDGDAGDVAGAHPPGHAQRQRLERAQVAGLVVEGLPDDREHLEEVAELDEARGDGEDQAEGDQGDDDDLAPKQVVDGVEHEGHSLIQLRRR